LQATLSDVVQQATNRYGTVQVAVMLDSWRHPLLIGEQLAKPMRLWSLSKAVVATALLRQREQRDAGTGDLALYLERALQRSDNCAMRELTIKLQDDTGGIEGARSAIKETTALTGATVDIANAQTDTEGSVCISPTYAGLSSSFAHRRALLAGTAIWTINDAIHFVHGLQTGALNVSGQRSVAEMVLALMRLRKEPSDEPAAGPLKAPSEWGAGDVFAAPCWNIAYKAGWGGAQAHIPWLASQIGTVALADGHHLAFAIAVHPNAQPPDDDPGLTDAPQAISLVLGALRTYLQSEQLCK
jgi:CubicO group peptidase (beta-lactamase class C family)